MTENARKFIASFQDVIQANVFTSKCEFLPPDIIRIKKNKYVKKSVLFNSFFNV